MRKNPGHKPKTRNSHQRERKKIVLLIAEGKNKTETLYFKSMSNPNYVIRFAPGNYTDPVNMVRALRKEYDDLGLDEEWGDMAFCLVDSDTNPAKDRQLEKADAEAEGRIDVVVSSPCFEVWYLCHFTASARQYASNKDVLAALKHYIPEYGKEMQWIWRLIGDSLQDGKETGYTSINAPYSGLSLLYSICLWDYISPCSKRQSGHQHLSGLFGLMKKFIGCF